MAYKVVLTDHVYPDLEYEKKTLASAGAELVFIDTKDEAEIVKAAADADIVITCYANITANVIKGMEKCKSISKTGIGVNNIDIRQASAQGIRVLNVPDYCIEEVSDHAVALMLGVARRIGTFNNATHKGIWSLEGNRDMIRLRSKILGLLGFGRTAKLTAQKMKGFGMEILAYDPYVDAEQCSALGVKKAELNEVVEKSHIISINLPLTEETEGMVNDDFLSRVRDGAILVNTARGGLINEPALLKALQSGKLTGAGLDVLVNEADTSDNPLCRQENAVVTPHAAFCSVEATQELREKIMADVLLVLEGKEPKNQVNR
ncbi:MAG: C-terminal binding protein [Defluviitaleaceae bacterium]|nr:C-terminal binding protein [Defluviitaleaceae bacterium]